MPMWTVRGPLVAVAVAVLVAVVASASPAAAAPAWIAPQTFGPAVAPAGSFATAVGADGTVAGTYVDAGTGKVALIVRRPGAAAAGPEIVGTAGASAPQVAIDGAGAVTLAWLASSGGHVRIFTAVRDAATGAWGTPAPVSASTQDVNGFHLAENAQGVAVLGWVTGTGYPFAATREPGAAFGAPAQVPGQDPTRLSLQVPEVAVGPTGAAVIGWPGLKTLTDVQVQVSTRQPGGAFGSVVSLPVSAGAGAANDLRLAVGALGTMAATYIVNGASGVGLHVALRGTSGGWSQSGTQVVAPGSALGVGSVNPDVAIEPDGTVVLAFLSGSPEVVMSGPGNLVTMAHPLGGGWSAGQQISGAPALFRLTTLPAGSGTALGWFLDLERQFFSATRPPDIGSGSAFGPPLLPDPSATYEPGTLSSIATAAGDLLYAWQPTGLAQVRYVALDGSPPTIADPGIPATAVAGTPTAFAVAATDAWSAIGTVTWSFGDGSGDGAGRTVSHAFPAPGTYAVKVTVPDALGNAATATRQVVVSAASQGGSADTTPPVVSALTVSRRSFRVGPKPTALGAALKGGRGATGTTIAFRLSERASVAIAVQRRSKTGWKTAGILRRASLAPGARTLAFSGRLGRAALARGRYRISVTATDPAGNRSAPRVAGFKIL